MYWDPQNRNFLDLKTRLMPASDQSFAALLHDLDARGLLDETVIIGRASSACPPTSVKGRSGARGRGATSGRTVSPLSWPARGARRDDLWRF